MLLLGKEQVKNNCIRYFRNSCEKSTSKSKKDKIIQLMIELRNRDNLLCCPFYVILEKDTKEESLDLLNTYFTDTSKFTKLNK